MSSDIKTTAAVCQEMSFVPFESKNKYDQFEKLRQTSIFFNHLTSCDYSYYCKWLLTVFYSDVQDFLSLLLFAEVKHANPALAGKGSW